VKNSAVKQLKLEVYQSDTKILTLPIDEQLTRDAGSLKCAYESNLSLVDAYIIAIARRLKGTLVTTDSRLAELKVVQTKLLQIP